MIWLFSYRCGLFYNLYTIYYRDPKKAWVGDWDAFIEILLRTLSESRYDKIKLIFSIFDKLVFEDTDLKKFFSESSRLGWYIFSYDISFNIQMPSIKAISKWKYFIKPRLNLIFWRKSSIRQKTPLFKRTKMEIIINRNVDYSPVEQFVWSGLSI